jgi:hypothetical protein
MKLPTNLGLKIYLILFGLFSFSELIALSTTESAAYIYYNTLLTFHPPAGTWYVLAIVNAVISCACMIPLFRRAFSLPRLWIKSFQWLFWMRLGSTVLGNNYEFVTLRSCLIGTPLIAYILIVVWLLFFFPSFKEHYIYAFKR